MLHRERGKAEVFVALGSNIGNRRDLLQTAVAQLESVFDGFVQCSQVYETKPVGFLEQPDFLNMVIRSNSTLSPLELLDVLHQIEQNLGRKRGIRFGPRTIDLDILLYGNSYVCFRKLQIPHPRMWQRAFVMVPLSELAPFRRGPGGETISAIAARLQREEELRNVGYLR